MKCYPKSPTGRRWKIILHQILETATEPPLYIFSWDVMSSLQDPLCDTFDRIRDSRHPQIVELDKVARRPSPSKKRDVRLSAKCALEGKALAFRDTIPDFTQQNPSTFRASWLGASGERPFAISSALRKRTSVARFLRNSVAKVVFPAPLQPAMR